MAHALNHPLGNEKLKEALAPFGPALLSLIAEQDGTRAARRLSTMQRNGELSEAHDTIARLKVSASTPEAPTAALPAAAKSSRRRARR